MSKINDCDVIIVGAGIIGICCALELVARGFKIQVIDRDGPAEGASHGNAGVISPWSCVPQSMPGQWKKIPRWILSPEGPVALRWTYAPRMLTWLVRFLASGQIERLDAIANAMLVVNRDCINLYRQLLSGTGHEDLVRDSCYIHVYRDPAMANPELLQWALRRERGVPMEFITGDELQEIEPALAPDYRAAVIIREQARALNPGKIGLALAEKAQKAGVQFTRAQVHQLQPTATDQWVVRTDNGELNSAKVVLAAGAWSARLLKPLGVEIPLEAERGYHVVFEQPGIELNNSVLNKEGLFATSSMEMGLRCAGIAEFAGLDASPDYRRAKILATQAKRMLPELNTDSISEWMGSRPATPDSLPCIGVVPGHRELFGAFGHGHLGLTGAPMTGLMIASALCGENMGIDLSPYRLDRF